MRQEGFSPWRILFDRDEAFLRIIHGAGRSGTARITYRGLGAKAGDVTEQRVFITFQL